MLQDDGGLVRGSEFGDVPPGEGWVVGAWDCHIHRKMKGAVHLQGRTEDTYITSVGSFTVNPFHVPGGGGGAGPENPYPGGGGGGGNEDCGGPLGGGGGALPSR